MTSTGKGGKYESNELPVCVGVLNTRFCLNEEDGWTIAVFIPFYTFRGLVVVLRVKSAARNMMHDG
jgi:hypothetical protein